MDYRGFLDRVRWIAALVVAIGHALAILNSETSGARWITAIADMREGAVVVFFILSGYLVGGAVQRNADSFQWRGYAIARLARIYVVLVPALVLTALVDGAVYLLDPANPVYALPWQAGALGDTALSDRYGPAQILGSVLSIEPLTGKPMGSAGSLWSLGFEWMFYFLFPALWLPARKWLGPRGAVQAMVLSAMLGFFLPRLAGPIWTLWLAGAAAYGLERRGTLQGRAAPLLRLVSALVVLAYVVDGAGRSYTVLLPVVGLAGMVFLAAGRQGEARQSGPIDARLADFSFSLYAIHLQLMAGMAALLLRLGLLPSSGIADPATVVMLALAMTAVSVTVAYVFGQVFESRTAQFAAFLKGLRLPRPPRLHGAALPGVQK